MYHEGQIIFGTLTLITSSNLMAFALMIASQYIIWMNAGKTNTDPLVIASYFCHAALNIGGIPERI